MSDSNPINQLVISKAKNIKKGEQPTLDSIDCVLIMNKYFGFTPRQVKSSQSQYKFEIQTTTASVSIESRFHQNRLRHF